MIEDIASAAFSLLAQAAPAAPGGGGQPLPPAPTFVQVLVQMAPFILIFIVFFWLMGSAKRRQEKERNAMLSALKKGDRVRMTGGELGSVVEVRDTDVLIKVDESSNTKIRYVREAVAAVVNDKPAEK
jgi:preprotein translocase subunit YajC